MSQISTIILPDDTRWTDQFDWSQLLRTSTRTVAGNNIIQIQSKIAGRPVTLDCRWITLAILNDICALRDDPSIEDFAVSVGGSGLTCTFRTDVQVPVEVTPLIEYSTVTDDDLFQVVLYLETTSDIITT